MEAKPYAESDWPPKAYKNADFLNSSEARKVRVLCEMTEPELRFRAENIEDTIVMFGSARIRPPKEAAEKLKAAENRITGNPNPSKLETEALRQAKTGVKAAPYYDACVDLSAALTRWSMGLKDKRRRFIICSGGGPGIMEAANRGARKAGGCSIGLGISLPFEQGLNPYITRNMKFEFHYFFVRKYWFVYLAKALIVFPGGFGTMDELFETLTLVQTRKIKKAMPVVLYGSEFWNGVLNFDKFVEWGVISPEDLDLFKICDSVREAKDHVTTALTERYLSDASPSKSPS